MKGWVRWVVVLGLAAGAVLALRATLFRPRPVEVEVARVTRGLVEDAVTNSTAGTIKSRRRARVGAERAGRVAAIAQREGAEIPAGTVILTLDATTQRTQLDLARRDLEVARAGLESARAAARGAKQEYDRTAALLKDRLVSQGQMDLATTRKDAADAELSAAEARIRRSDASIRMAQEELGHLEVRAPFSGVITLRFVEVGESVIPGQGVVEMIAPDSLYCSAPIDEIDIGRLKEGLPARVQLDPYPKLTWHGAVTRVAPIVNDFKEQNRTLEVEVDLRPDPTLPRPKPGTSADVEIILDERDGVLRVPTFAVVEGKRVLLARGGRAVTRAVVAGLRNWDWTEIREGLAEGDLVITNLDKQGVKEGAVILVKGGAAAGGAESAVRR